MRTDRFITNLLLLTFLSIPVLATAGSLDAPAAPTTGSGMPTTTDIFYRLNTGAANSVVGSFQEPAAGPTVGTGKSLADIESKLPVVDNTNGATVTEVAAGKTFWGLRSDGTWGVKTGVGDSNLISGNIKSGVSIFGITGDPNVVDTSSGTATSADLVCGTKAWVAGVELIGTGAFSYSDRWTDNCDGTITDKTTHLIWMKDSSVFGQMDWSYSIYACTTLAFDGSRGLRDGSVAGDWRLPNKDELAGLANGSEPVRLATPGPFVNVDWSHYYWSSTPYANNTSYAWHVYFSDGYVNYYIKTSKGKVRCVR